MSTLTNPEKQLIKVPLTQSAIPFKFSTAPKPRAGLPGIDWPLNVQIQTHSTCNATCVICPYPGSWNDKNRGVMDDRLFDTILDELKDYQLGKFCLYLQNEPFIDTRWFDWAEKAVNTLSFQRFEVSTNLSPLNERNINRLAGLVEVIPHEIWISFHGVDKESYERIMGLKFERALKNLEYFARVAQEHNLVFRVHGMGEPKLLSHKEGYLFDSETYNKFLQDFASERSLRPLPVRFYKYHDRAGNVNDVQYNFNYHRPDLKGCYCHRVDTWLHVRYNGEIIFCCHDYSRKSKMGNLNQHSIKDFFQSDEFKLYRDQALGLEKSPDNFICKTCAFPGG